MHGSFICGINMIKLLHGGLGQLLGSRIAKHSCAVCAKLRFVGVNGGFDIMADGTQRINVALTSKVWRFGNRHVVFIAQFLHIHL